MPMRVHMRYLPVCGLIALLITPVVAAEPLCFGTVDDGQTLTEVRRDGSVKRTPVFDRV